MSSEVNKVSRDLTSGPLAKQILVFSIPLVLSNLLQVLFNMSDIAVVGQFAGSHALGSVGSTTTLVTLFTTFLIGVSGGVNVMTAQYIGAKKDKDVREVVHSAAWMCALMGVILLLFGQVFSKLILEVMKTKEELIDGAALYLRIYFLGMPVILLYNFEAAIFRSIGETKMPLIALTLSGILNVLLNLFFVIVLKMSVNGVATATVLANVVSAGILYIKLVKSDKYIKVEFKKLRIDGKVFAKIMQIGLPAGIQSAVFAVANIVIQGAINSLGTVVIAASSAAFNIEIIAYNVMTSFSQACTTFVGQNFGANKLDRCNCIGHGNTYSAYNRKIFAVNIQQRPRSNRNRLYKTCNYFYSLHILNAV